MSSRLTAAHRVIDSGRSVAEIAGELTLGDALLTDWVRVNLVRMQAVLGPELETLTSVARAELLRLRKQFSGLKKDDAFLGKDRCL